MIQSAQMKHRSAGHNCSFFVIVARGDTEVGLKLTWGDYNPEDLADRLFQLERPKMEEFLKSLGWEWDAKTRVVKVPSDVPVHVLSEQDSYWQLPEKAKVEDSGKASEDENSRSSYRDWLPTEAVVLDAGYVRAASSATLVGTEYQKPDFREQCENRVRWEEEHSAE